jgi:hypothetical protein
MWYGTISLSPYGVTDIEICNSLESAKRDVEQANSDLRAAHINPKDLRLAVIKVELVEDGEA